MRDLSVLITARNEEFLSRTVEDVLAKKRGNTDVIVILDGAWASPPLQDHKDLTIVYHPESIGQRAAINEAARISDAKYIMKLDAHCIVDEGFDVKLMEKCEHDWMVVPRMYNLHAFDWMCKECKERWYQGPTPEKCKREGCKSKRFARVMIWKPRWHKLSDYMRFDHELHFQYFGALGKRPGSEGDIADTMSFVGACWFVNRQRYWEIGGLDEEYGSWGQMGTELSCKSWLSGGSVKVNKKTWFAHLFRTQGKDFSFPYPQSQRQIDGARKRSKDLFLNNKWPKQTRPLSWLLDHFYPLPDWHDEKGKKVLEYVKQKGIEFNQQRGVVMPQKPTKGIIYYTDNQLNLKIAHACKNQTKSIGLPIFSASLKPMDMGKNIVLPFKRGYKAYFNQIVAALELCDTDIVYFCEHDWLYHPSHFEFTPSEKDTFYYNWNWWRVRSTDGHAVHYDTQLLPSICGYRDLLLEYYRKQRDYLAKHDFDTKVVLRTGFEPGTHNRVPELSGYKIARFDSKYPNIDIRHTSNLSPSKWSVDAFRSPRNARGWVESDYKSIPGWTERDFRWIAFE